MFPVQNNQNPIGDGVVNSSQPVFPQTNDNNSVYPNNQAIPQQPSISQNVVQQEPSMVQSTPPQQTFVSQSNLTQQNPAVQNDISQSTPTPQNVAVVQQPQEVQEDIAQSVQVEEIPESEKVELKDLFQTMFSFELFIKLVELSLAKSIMTQEPNYEFFMTVYNAMEKFLETIDEETVNEFQEQIADVIVDRVQDIRSLKDQGMTEEQYDAFVKALGFQRAEPTDIK